MWRPAHRIETTAEQRAILSQAGVRRSAVAIDQPARQRAPSSNRRRRLRDGARSFIRAKRIAIAGLTLGFVLWQVGFISVGGEWFGMWMSSQWNGVPDAFRFFITMLAVLIFVAQRDDELV